MKKILTPLIAALALSAPSAASAQSTAFNSCDETYTNAGVLCASGDQTCYVWLYVKLGYHGAPVCVGFSPE